VHAATWSTSEQSVVARHTLDADLGSPDANGAMALAGGGWASTWNSHGSVEVATWGDGAEPPRRTRLLDGSCWDAQPAVAGDRDGRLLVASGGRCGDEGGIGFVSRAANGTTFSQESQIGTSEHPRPAPHLAIDGDGRATIVWQVKAPDGRQAVRAATVALP
jgi:hypothetical protein